MLRQDSFAMLLPHPKVHRHHRPSMMRRSRVQTPQGTLNNLKMWWIVEFDIPRGDFTAAPLIISVEADNEQDALHKASNSAAANGYFTKGVSAIATEIRDGDIIHEPVEGYL